MKNDRLLYFNDKNIFKEEQTDSLNSRTSFFAAKNMNEKVVSASSSGGLFTAIAERILDEGGIVYGAGVINGKVCHIRITDKVDICKLQGSKYVQSNTLLTFSQVKQDLKDDKVVYYSGTPCQINGLISYLGNRHDKLITQDLVCHGVPSPSLWNKYLYVKESSVNSRATYVNFREKSRGWKDYQLRIDFENGKSYIASRKEDLYMQAFLRNYSLRPSCYHCQFKSLVRDTDITLGDLWGAEVIIPDVDSGNGLSLVLVHSSKAMELINELLDKDVIRIWPISNYELVVQKNPSLCISSPRPEARKSFFIDYKRENVETLLRRKLHVSLKEKVKRYLKRKIKKYRY